MWSQVTLYKTGPCPLWEGEIGVTTPVHSDAAYHQITLFLFVVVVVVVIVQSSVLLSAFIKISVYI